MDEKIFTHSKAETSDKIRLIGELEHIRAHSLRSVVVSAQNQDKAKATEYLLLANTSKELRRRLMQTWFPDVDTRDWCLCKSAATLRQIAYEIWGCKGAIKADDLVTIDELVDRIWGNALNEDLSDCNSCKEDKDDVK